MWGREMELLPKTITRSVGRLGAAAQNALEVARFGGLDTEEEPSPYAVISEQRVYRLRRYYGEEDASEDGSAAGAGPPVLLVPPLMLAAEGYDVPPATSAVTVLHRHGADPWVVDFGAPEREEGGLERTLADHVLAVSDAVTRVREITGRAVHLGGSSRPGWRNCSPIVCSECGRCRHGPAGPAFACLTRSSRCAAGSTSSCSCTTVRRCFRVRARGAFWRPTAGSPGRGLRWPTSCASSSPTTGCSRVASRSR